MISLAQDVVQSKGWMLRALWCVASIPIMVRISREKNEAVGWTCLEKEIVIVCYEIYNIRQGDYLKYQGTE